MHQRIGFLLVLLALCCTIVGTACGGASEDENVLDFSITTSERGLTLTVEDKRPGEHTVWAVVRDANGTRLREFVALNPGTEGSSSVRGEIPLESGTYTYSVYDIDGVHTNGLTAMETPNHESDAGEFQIP